MVHTHSYKLKSLVAVLGLVQLALAGPTLSVRNTDSSATITVCADVGANCVGLPVVSDSCLDFTGGLTFLNKAVSSAVIPGGFVCTFFSQFECTSQGEDDEVVLTGGTWSFFDVPGPSSPDENFNDLASSVSCSPI
ncbi:hypothetical protein CPC08DRAFT_824764 [Agrocybe pediades]|nr:hypothetical protein CPC08DRAFT_824764 [Agrocybe pediades]